MDPKDVLQKILEHYNVLLYGPPGTGKTYLMQQVAKLFVESIEGAAHSVYAVDTASETKPIVAKPTERAKTAWVTFHQSYSYEEFLIGLRPNPQSQQLLSLRPEPGLLLELAEFARLSEHYSLLIIDEINRGNVSRIFGEFITLLEPDKRLDGNNQITNSTVMINLPYIKGGMTAEIQLGTQTVQVPNPYAMPLRVYTLASMNSVDKSVAPLDTALRRRFHIINLTPDLNQMAQIMGLTQAINWDDIALPDPLSSVDHVKILGVALVNHINHGISVFLGPEFSLGEWYLKDLLRTFADVEQAESTLVRIWQFSILPQLEELFHGRIEQLELVLKLDAKNTQLPVNIIQPGEDLGERGALPYLQKKSVTNEEAIKFLRRVCGVKLP